MKVCCSTSSNNLGSVATDGGESLGMPDFARVDVGFPIHTRMDRECQYV